MAAVLRAELPATRRAMLEGHGSRRHAEVVARGTVFLSRAQRAVVDAELWPHLGDLSVGRLRRRVSARAYALDPEGHVAHIARQHEERHVSVRPTPDTMAVLSAFLPATQAVAVWGALAEELAAGENTGGLIYASTKRALSVWVRQRSVTPDWAGAGIPLNAVAPGIVTTPMTKDLLGSEESIAFHDAVVPMPLNYHQPPESIANLLIWLTSVENTHCAGQTIYCDGGADVVLRGEDAWSWADPRVNEYFTKLTSGAGQAEPADGTPES